MHRLLITLTILLCSISACERSTSDTDKSVSTTKPMIEKFLSNPSHLDAGGRAHVEWTTRAKRVWLDGVEVATSGQAEIEIRESRSIRLKAEDQNGVIVELERPVQIIQTQLERGDFPILFVTQIPLDHDKNTRLSAFANHRTRPQDVPRGGDLMLWYPNGKIRNLTREAGFGSAGFQGKNAIAVREPHVHWSGKKALFSMLVGAPEQGQTTTNKSQDYRWQIYEVSGLEPGQKANIRKIGQQDPLYNNLSPIYDADDNLIFTSDRPRTGWHHLYPQLDEYEATPSISGLWKLHHDGRLQLLSHTPSGAFQPIIDRYGRVLFTRWDHLQQDQLADRDRDAQGNGVKIPFDSFNYSSEARDANKLQHRQEIFPESRVGSTSAYGKVSAYRNNFFAIWQIDQDGGNEETINHLGLHELSFGYVAPSFIDDPALSQLKPSTVHQNQIQIKREGGLFHIQEDPLQAGRYFATKARESGSFTSDSIISFEAPPGLNPEQIKLTAITPLARNDQLIEGRLRNPLPLSNGKLLAAHTPDQLPPEENHSLQALRLRYLKRGEDGLFHPDTYLTPGIQKKVQWWDGEKQRSYQGPLWELEAVELRPRPRARSQSSFLEAPELTILQQEQVTQEELIHWLQENQLALIITRDQTSRDRADHEQPLNLKLKGGKQTRMAVEVEAKDAPQTQPKIYEISHFQILQAEQIRAYADRPGRRHLAQAIVDFPNDRIVRQESAASTNAKASKENKLPSSSVPIFPDGSSAAFVPAERALTWQSTDENGVPIVRERNWVSFKSGEIRVCASCHGVNQRDQSNQLAPLNPPEALRDLLQKWKKYRQNAAK
ncbi:hypothetical protein RF679_06130 [Undibacterium cyanobacteriorum]|uniref:Hydrazine synthase alpha subunit middle domain-containing protein n=1 Tax=Undibacterium cyanobacteriorum TaxID=3073561 RepID=A0ABY9RKW6_9BURK|nr:hypothetical protein [Undibacterium sp. 20NA77.5]WMW81858.1 hypothetical protein RF679_06130 [Undibacterium sp. 20NA77.5]